MLERQDEERTKVQVAPVPEDCVLSLRKSERREFRSESLVALSSENECRITPLEELKHILLWTMHLIPSMIWVVVSVSLNALFFEKAIPPDSPRFMVIARVFVGLTLFFASIGIMQRGLRFTKLEVLFSSFATFGFFGGLLALMARFRFPWETVTSMVAISLTHGTLTWFNMVVMQVLSGARFLSVKVHLIAVVTGSSATIAMLACIGYGLITQREYSWYAEWLVAGVAFPLVSLLAGRFLVADVISFAVLWAFPEGSSTSVLTFFSLVVKIGFYLSGQVALFGLSSSTAFYLSIAVTSLAEIVGTYGNAKMTRMLHEKAQGFRVDPKSENLVHQWVAVRASVSDEKLVLHTHNELIGEKIVLCAAIAAVLQGESTIKSDAFSQVILLTRALLLAIAEMLQDLLQRRVLLATTGLTVTGIPPRILGFGENFSILCQLLMVLNLLKMSQSLLEIEL